MSFLRGIKRFGRSALRGLKGAGRGVLKVGRKVVDGVNKGFGLLDKAKNIPIVGDYVELANNIPQVQLLRAGTGLADSAISTGEALQDGNFDEAIKRGIKTGERGIAMKQRLKR